MLGVFVHYDVLGENRTSFQLYRQRPADSSEAYMNDSSEAYMNEDMN